MLRIEQRPSFLNLREAGRTGCFYDLAVNSIYCTSCLLVYEKSQVFWVLFGHTRVRNKSEPNKEGDGSRVMELSTHGDGCF